MDWNAITNFGKQLVLCEIISSSLSASRITDCLSVVPQVEADKTFRVGETDLRGIHVTETLGLVLSHLAMTWQLMLSWTNHHELSS